jgi:hypothetical protein
MAMRKHLFLLPLLTVAACGPSDRCQAPPLPKLISVANLSLEQKADAMGVPPSQVPQDAVGGPAFEVYVGRHNEAVQIGYCVENEAYKARGMKDEMSTVARAVMATCKESNESDTLATVLQYRNCAVGNK